MRITIKFIRIGIQLYDWMFPKEYSPVSTHHISAAKLPWLFVGVELINGTIMDRTQHVQHLVDSGFPITPTTVTTSIDPDLIKRCFYLDEKTLKEEEIPTDGLTINDS